MSKHWRMTVCSWLVLASTTIACIIIALYKSHWLLSRGEFSRAPRRFGGPAITQNTEKGVPDGSFLTSYLHKIHFRPGLRPDPAVLDPAGRAYDAPRPLVGWWGDTPPHVSSIGAFLSARTETVIGPTRMVSRAVNGSAVILVRNTVLVASPMQTLKVSRVWD